MALLRDALGEDLEGLRTYEALTTRMREVLQEIRTSRRILEHEAAIVEDQLRIGMKHQCSCCGIAVLIKRGRCCGQVWYCSRECHKADWDNHKPLCLRRPARRAAERLDSDLDSDIDSGPTLPPRRQVTMHLMGQPEYRGMSVEEVEEILRVEDEAAEQALMHSYYVQDSDDALPTQNAPTQNAPAQNTPAQNTPVQTARVSDAMWDLLTTVPNRTYVPPYPPRVNPPIQHFFMHDARLDAQFDNAVADLVTALVPPDGPPLVEPAIVAPPIEDRDDAEDVD
jgi:hypothetical protein